ncbi:hypothetical protein HMPREF1177_00862 [Eikenella corrodens CC92I]|uniref:Uncharacterized protein n=1 Tax=Eikenella corrodens CC92I TaxID=1073362 RepID=V7IBV7_EIKCO|nr:hypothetical protein HMPREF1177_00862 [Eikenella corrodens CC92I]
MHYYPQMEKSPAVLWKRLNPNHRHQLQPKNLLLNGYSHQVPQTGHLLPEHQSQKQWTVI